MESVCREGHGWARTAVHRSGINMSFRVREIQNRWGSLAGAEWGLTEAPPERLVVLLNILFSFFKVRS